jgi:hypothetical protein
VARNSQEIAVQKKAAELISMFETKDIDRIETIASGNQEKIWRFTKEYGLQIAQLAALVAVLAKMANIF